MCLLGRKTDGQVVSVTSTGADQQFLSSNVRRVAIVFSPPVQTGLAVDQRYTVSFGNTAVIDVGVSVHSGSTPFVLTAHDVGDLITRPIRVIGSAAGFVIAAVEVMDMEHAA